MFNFDKDFNQRWENTPAMVRQVLQNDLARLEQLLDPDTDFEKWKTQELKSRLQSNQMIEQTYLDIKQNLKLTKQNLLQMVLEKKLAQKRADEIAHQQKLQQEEIQQNLKQIQTLQHIGTQVQQESQNYAERYGKTAPSAVPLNPNDQRYIDNLRLHLEFETETFIQQAVQDYRQSLRQIAQEEIELLLLQAEEDIEKLKKSTPTAKTQS